MSTLDYTWQHWTGVMHNDQEYFTVSMSDAIFQEHLTKYLESISVPPLTYRELMEYAHQVLEQRYQAVQHLRNLDYWRNCGDPHIRIIRHTTGTSRGYEARCISKEEEQ